jgi:phenylacetate-CoA ligase
MARIVESIYPYLPSWGGDLAVTVGSTWFNHIRRAGDYQRKKEEYRKLWRRPHDEVKEYQRAKLNEIFQDVKRHSRYYRYKYQGIDRPMLENLPILEKEELRQDIDQIVIGDKRQLVESYTGGTTGKGIMLYSKWSTLQARHALLDLFWEMHDCRLGDRFAWFSGRHLISNRDERKNIFWRTNWLLHIRYYSTFHTSLENLHYYVDNLNRYQPKVIHGFPSPIYEIAQFMKVENIRPSFQLKAIFTTSETLHNDQRESIESVFQCKVRDYWGAAEGPPLIMECPEGNRHIDMAGGIIEVTDAEGKPAQEGEVLVTSFTMRETPIIRYRIGDRIRLSGEIGCPCGMDTPIVAEVMGRKTDFIEIPGRGKIWCAHIGDCVKHVNTVVRFQVELVDGSRLKVFMVADREQFEKKDRETFLKQLHERVGDIPVDIVHVTDIPRLESGKHSVIRKPNA